MNNIINSARWPRAEFIIFLVALTCRIIYFIQNQDNPLLYSQDLDEAYYVNMAESVSEDFTKIGNRLSFMDPLYGYILGCLFYFFGSNLTTIRLIQIIMDSLNAILIYSIGSKIWNRQAGMISAMAYAIYKVAFFYTLLILKTTFSLSALLFFTFFLLRILDTQKSWLWFFLGSWTAVMTYLRANFMLLILLTVFSYALLERPGWKIFLKHMGFFVMGCICLFVLCNRVNTVISGPKPNADSQSLRAAVLIYSCNNAHNLTGCYTAPAFSDSRPEESEFDFQKEAESRLGRSLTSKEVSRYWIRETTDFFIKYPRQIFTLFINKLKWSITDYEIPVNEPFYIFTQFSSLIQWPLPTFAFAFGVGVPGLMMGIFRRKRVAWLMVPILTTVFTIIFFCTSSRFRMPMIPFLLIGAGICIATLMEWFRKCEMIKIVMLIPTVVILYLLSFLIPAPKPNGFEEFFLAKAYWAQHEWEKARKIALEASERFPTNTKFSILLGIIALSENRFDEAIRYNLSALKADPHNAIAYHHLGIAYINAGYPDKAIPFIKRALSLGPDQKQLFDLARAYEMKGNATEAIHYYNEFLKLSKTTDPLQSLARKNLSAIEDIRKKRESLNIKRPQ